ncbi:GAF domain-containing protein [Alginatibacterium sediminis]|uniref:GAF domain-containing protein n=1 Tax=Alginatibacterium sediminis TaxID=2164068 RepID=A0A420EHS9_9ALTE|nr:GAF domain-containing protein [Alginatibacterium sediminis]RKF20116.1 GAF domain-containing protein [Alginatibacterium sediminis]
MNYSLIARQCEGLLDPENHYLSNLANFSAMLWNEFQDINWLGFYLYDSQRDQLILGPFQGNVACTNIAPGKGVCGGAYSQQQILRIADVDQFPGHIACDAASRSEIVVPIYHADKVVAVLDIDSPLLSRFTQEDQQGLQDLVNILEKSLVKFDF